MMPFGLEVANQVLDCSGQAHLKNHIDSIRKEKEVWKQRYIGLLMSLVEPDEIQDVLDTLEYE